MSKRSLLGLVAFALAASIIAVIYNNNSHLTPNKPQPIEAASQSSSSSKRSLPLAKGEVFAGTPLYRSAYLIFPGELSADAKEALTGFSMSTSDLGQGKTEVKLKAIEAGYRDQQFTVKPGDKIYFVEFNMKDDNSGKNADYNQKDDIAVMTDAEGKVL